MLTLLYIVTAVLLAYAGAKLAEHYGRPAILGGLVGLVFHLPGLLVLWIVLALLGGTPKG